MPTVFSLCTCWFSTMVFFLEYYHFVGCCSWPLFYPKYNLFIPLVPNLYFPPWPLHVAISVWISERASLIAVFVLERNGFKDCDVIYSSISADFIKISVIETVLPPNCSSLCSQCPLTGKHLLARHWDWSSTLTYKASSNHQSALSFCIVLPFLDFMKMESHSVASPFCLISLTWPLLMCTKTVSSFAGISSADCTSLHLEITARSLGAIPPRLLSLI